MKNLDNYDELQESRDEIIIIGNKQNIAKSKKKFSHPVLNFNDSSDENNFKTKKLVAPDTHFSPKDKISNFTWENKIPLGCDCGVNTVFKTDSVYGSVINLDYDKIINSDDVVTGAELSPFDRCVYDAVVTLHVAGNDTFTTADIWRIVSHNSKAKITPIMRDKISKSMFHISKFWLTIVTDYSDKIAMWNNLNRDKTFKSERQLYKNLQATYTGRLLDFRVIGRITYDVTYTSEGKEIIDKISIPEVWKLGFPPILYQYANAKGQVSAVPMNLISTSKKNDKKSALKRGVHTDELSAFLVREIDTMKRTAKRKKAYSNIIKLEQLYKIDGIDNIQQGTNDLNLKKSRTRNKLVKILDRFRENGMINSYTFHKKTIGRALTFHSVEIFF